jgi:hypothetical protein
MNTTGRPNGISINAPIQTLRRGTIPKSQSDSDAQRIQKVICFEVGEQAPVYFAVFSPQETAEAQRAAKQIERAPKTKTDPRIHSTIHP